MKIIRYWLRNVFGFSQVEIRGFYTITLLMVLVISAPFFYGWLTAQPPADFTADKAILDSLVSVSRSSLAASKTLNRKPALADSPPSRLFNFDPNRISSQEWQTLGIQAFIAERIIKYRQKGGRFRIKQDILKIYGFPADAYTRLVPYILLPDSVTYNKNSPSIVKKQEEIASTVEKAPKAPLAINLNTADTTELKQIRGIGSGLSRRILNYRNALGGFVKEEQIREVYGLDSTVASELLKYGFVAERTTVKKIAINKATIQELDAHPYITPKIANIIVAYRQQHGPYQSIENVYNIRALDKKVLDKLAPYFSFE